MADEFRKPDFRKHNLELRFENDVICIYGTEEGLKEIINECRFLIEKPSMGHIHIEDNANVTPQSLRAAIAIFPAE